MSYRQDYINTASKPIEVIHKDFRIVNVIESCDNSLKQPHQIVFVVSKSRGFVDYKKVLRHNARTNKPNFKLTPYSESLLSEMFGGW